MTPTLAPALFFEGVACMASDAAKAQNCFRQALAQDPQLMEAHVNLGLLLEDEGAFDEAAACYLRAMVLRPEQMEPYLNLGGLLAKTRRLDAAEAAYRQALRLEPESSGIWSNLGALHAARRQDAQALQCYRHALALEPTYAKARFNLACLLLRQGQWEEGWQALEARDWYLGLAARLSMPRWQGESLADKSVLVGFEAGHGDMIQMVRYASLLQARGARHITVLCHPALKRLFAAVPAVDLVLGFDEPLPDRHWDVWTPPLSLPLHFQTRPDTIPAVLPYLQAPPPDVAKWADVLPASGVRVGLVWRGNPRFENDALRSLASLQVLAPLATVPGVCWVSLQKGVGEDEPLHPPSHWSVLPLGAQVQDFADMAALVSCLDLVITVDTAMAHLAGALAIPVWVLLPDYMTDWRWLESRSDSPWYPQVMRLFRQEPPVEPQCPEPSARDPWVPVVEVVRSALLEWVAEAGAQTVAGQDK